MEFYNTFIKVVLKEISKFNLNTEVYTTYVSQLTAALDEDFDTPYNRCAFMYRYATGFTYFFNDCTKKYFDIHSNTKDFISKWKLLPEVKVCSLSVGPGLDFLAFMLAVLKCDLGPKTFDITVVTKHGAWRNTASIVLEVFNELGSAFEVPCVDLNYHNVKIIQSDPLKAYLNGMKILAVAEANVILMMKTLNLLAAGSTVEGTWLNALKEMTSTLKPDTLIFCIDTKPSIAVITQALSLFPGKFLYGPVHQTIQLPPDFPEINGNHPVISVRGSFFVWQKLSSPLANACNPPPTNIGKEKKGGNSPTFCSSGDTSDVSLSADNATPVESNGVDNLSWKEFRSFLKCSSPKTKEILKRVLLSDEDNLDEMNELISQAEKLDINKKLVLETDCNRAKESDKLDDTRNVPTLSQRKMQKLCVDNQKTALEINYDIHSNVSGLGSSSPSDTLDSVSSFTCENNSSQSYQQNQDLMAISRESFQNYNQDGEKHKKDYTKENNANFQSSEDKIIQTDTIQDASHSSVKALTDKIRQLAISLERVSQQNVPSHSSVGDSCSFNQSPGNHAHFPDKPSCSKQVPSFGCKELDNCTTCHSFGDFPCKNLVGHCSCHWCRTKNCCLVCNHQQSREINLASVSSPNIVIPLQNISDTALLQIISILRSENKK